MSLVRRRRGDHNLGVVAFAIAGRVLGRLGGVGLGDLGHGRHGAIASVRAFPVGRGHGHNGNRVLGGLLVADGGGDGNTLGDSGVVRSTYGAGSGSSGSGLDGRLGGLSSGGAAGGGGGGLSSLGGGLGGGSLRGGLGSSGGLLGSGGGGRSGGGRL